MTTFALHFLLLLLPGYSLGRVLRLPFGMQLATAFLVFELSLTLGAGILSIVSLLGNLNAYRLTTTGCAIAVAGALWTLAWFDRKLPSLPETPSRERQLGSLIDSAIPLAALIVFSALLLWIVLSAYPSVEDSLAIKLPKVVFALQSNSFLPTSLSDDGRMSISPVYPALVQLFPIISGQKTHALLFLGFMNWLICGSAVYQLCRMATASQQASWIATALVMLSPVLLIQGSSEGDDIFAAAPFLLGLVFLFTWVNQPQRIYAALAGIGLGLSVGMKLFPLLYAPLIPTLALIAAFIFGLPQVLLWIRQRTIGWLGMLGGFALALLPHTIGNWIAFGSPFFVSSAVLATRNAPFSIECAVRDGIGYLKQFLLADPLRLAARLLSRPTEAANRYERTQAALERYGQALTNVVAFDPTPACTAYEIPFVIGRSFVSDNTVWYGVFGAVLIASCFAVTLSRRSNLLARASALSFLIWALTFAASQKYIPDIGRYWSLAVMAGTPAVAVIIDSLWRRESYRVGAFSFLCLAGFVTCIFGAETVLTNIHRSLPISRPSVRHEDRFPLEMRAHLQRSQSVNLYVTYGLDTYDYYLLMGNDSRLSNKATLSEAALNIVVVRPSGLMDNPYKDPRIPVKMPRPFERGFQFVGKVPPQPGNHFNLGFVNNAETAGVPRPTEPRSQFLLFEVQGLRREQSEFVGSLHQIASSKVVSSVQYRVGFRDPNRGVRLDAPWQNGADATFRFPTEANSIVIEARFVEKPNEVSTSEWPLRAVDSHLLEQLGLRFEK